MYVAVIPNRSSPPAILLRESYSENGKTKKRTLKNLSDWPAERIEQLRAVLRGEELLPATDAVEILRALPHGHVLAALGTARRIEAHVKLCVLALQMQRAAEIRCQLPWARIAHAPGGLKAVRYRCESRTIVQRTKISAELSTTLKSLGISAPNQIFAVEEPPPAAAAA